MTSSPRVSLSSFILSSALLLSVSTALAADTQLPLLKAGSCFWNSRVEKKGGAFELAIDTRGLDGKMTSQTLASKFKDEGVAAAELQRLLGGASKSSQVCEESPMRSIDGELRPLLDCVYAIDVEELPNRTWAVKVETREKFGKHVSAPIPRAGTAFFDLRSATLYTALFSAGLVETNKICLDSKLLVEASQELAPRRPGGAQPPVPRQQDRRNDAKWVRADDSDVEQIAAGDPATSGAAAAY